MRSDGQAAGVARYEFRIAETLSPTAAAAFDELTVRPERGGTLLYGPVRDPEHLYGLLQRVAMFGLTLEECRRLPD